MKLADIRTVLLTGPSTNDRFLREARGLRSAAFVEIHTTGGIIGVGETYAGYFCPELVPHIVEYFKPILIGQQIVPDDPSFIATLWERMYRCENFWCRVGLGAIVLTALEAALWDIAGKALSRPVHELLNAGTKHAKLLLRDRRAEQLSEEPADGEGGLLSRPRVSRLQNRHGRVGGGQGMVRPDRSRRDRRI